MARKPRANCAGLIKAILRDGDNISCSLGISRRKYLVYKSYDENVIEDLVDMGIDRDMAYNSVPISFTYSTHGHMPKLIYLKRSNPIRKRMIDYLYNCILREIPITRNGLAGAAGVNTKNWVEKDIIENYTQHSAKSLAGFIGGSARINNLRNFKIKQIINSRDGVPSSGMVVHGGTSTINAKIAHLAAVNSSGLNAILLRAIELGYVDDEYTAHCLFYKMAAERMEAEHPTKVAE